jgi:pimeloyl-ACP methyl ester carboxylesterase
VPRDASAEIGYPHRRGTLPQSPTLPTPWLPAYSLLPPSLPAAHVGVLLHGILGSARNLRSMAQQLAAQLPDWQWLLVDLCGHGDSTGAPAPHSVQACVADVTALCQHLGLQPSAVIGHSFGGKVALELARPQSADLWPRLRQVWALDTQPHLTQRDDAGKSGVLQVLEALREVPQPLAQRSDVVRELLARGQPQAIAQWMTTNVVQGPDGLRWRFDLDVIELLLASYFATDSWPALREPAAGVDVHLLRAGREPRWTGQLIAELDAARHPRLHVHVLANAGHWVHVDDLPGLLGILTPALASIPQ